MPTTVACYRCARRSYITAREWEAFRDGEVTEVESRCAGCGDRVSGCVCPSARVTA